MLDLTLRARKATAGHEGNKSVILSAQEEDGSGRHVGKRLRMGGNTDAGRPRRGCIRVGGSGTLN